MTSWAEEQVRRQREQSGETKRIDEALKNPPMWKTQRLITVDEVKEILNRLALNVEKYANTRSNVGKTPELLIVEAINELLQGEGK